MPAWPDDLPKMGRPSWRLHVREGVGKPRAMHDRVMLSPTLAVTSTGDTENAGAAAKDEEPLNVLGRYCWSFCCCNTLQRW